MRRILAVAALVAAGAGASAGEIAPTEVVIEDGAVKQSLTGVPGNLEEGKKIMNKGAGNCIACHQVSDLSDLPFHGNVGPSLDGVADRWTPEELRAILVDAKQVFPDTVMPSFYKTEGFIRPGDGFTGKAAKGPLKPLLTAQQIEDVIAYLMTLKEE